MNDTLIFATLSIGAAALATPRLLERLRLSRAKHRSLAGHARIARKVASLIPGYAFDEDRFFDSDGAQPEVIARRRAGFERMQAEFERRFPQGATLTRRARDSLSDLQFTGSYRVPFQYSPFVRSRLALGTFVTESAGTTVTDLDGNVFQDLTGSYGVNLLGNDAYKALIAQAVQRVAELGPVLGSLHPCVVDNAERLRVLSGLDEVSFHMSGTEAVMQAVRLARYNTGRSHVVRFTGAYHGWWEDVQPGIGNPSPVRETYTLADMSERTLKVLRTRRDIACVLVNPLQALHPNRNAPGDSALIDSSRRTDLDLDAYRRWLHELRAVCDQRGIVLILDEVFTGFRLARGGAQEFFGIQADMVTYGKTLGGGLPIGVVCGRRQWMQRFREERPADVCFARGTFNAHPYVMAAMNAFLDQLDTEATQRLYEDMPARWTARAMHLNARLIAQGLPVRVTALTTIWTVTYTRPSRYNWMLQFYLRLHGLALSWVGTGRMIFNLNHDADSFGEVTERFVAACQAMQDDGWWDGPAVTDRDIRRSVLREIFGQLRGKKESAQRAM